MQILEFYNSILGINHNSYSALPFPVEKVCFEKGETIITYEQIEDSIWFLNEGVVEMTIKSYNTEKIIDFFFEGDIFSGYTSFLTQKPTDIQTKTLTTAVIENIKRDDLFTAYSTSFEANKWGRICNEQAYIRKANREKEFLTKTAEERYSDLIDSRSNYITTIPVNKVAKYLGIHPESLSRIRKKMNR